MCEIFRILLDFKCLTIDGTPEELQSKPVSLNFEFVKNPIEPVNSCEADENDFGTILLTDGCHCLNQRFVFEPNSTTDEDFAFQALGSYFKSN